MNKDEHENIVAKKNEELAAQRELIREKDNQIQSLIQAAKQVADHYKIREGALMDAFKAIGS